MCTFTGFPWTYRLARVAAVRGADGCWWVCVFLSELTGGSRARCGWITARRKEPKHVSSSSSSISNKHGDNSYCCTSLSPGRTTCLLPDNSRWAGCQSASEEMLRGHFVGEQLVNAFVNLTGVLASAP